MSLNIDHMAETALQNLKKQINAHAEKLSLQIKQDFQNRKLATLWYRWEQKELLWDFNHLEDGHCQNSIPTVKHPAQTSQWKNGKWAKAFVQLNPGNVVAPFLVIL